MKNFASIWVEITLNVFINLGRINIFIAFKFPVHEVAFLCLFRFPLILFNKSFIFSLNSHAQLCLFLVSIFLNVGVTYEFFRDIFSLGVIFSFTGKL